MKRAKKLYVCGAVLLVVCAVTFGVSRYEQHQEDIKNSDETILAISAEDVTGLSWEYEDTSLAFHKDENWSYDDDSDFPVSEDKVTELLGVFEDFGAAFEIDDVEDESQYGLDDPTCTIQIETADDSYEIRLGDFSVMDEQRYVSIGDGKVYLASVDPMDSYEITLSDMIENDTTPQLSAADSITFAGAEDYSVSYEEDSTDSYDETDVYYVKNEEGTLALDTTLVENYLTTVGSLDLSNYVSYNATDDEIATYGLDDPELTVTIAYTGSQESSGDEDDTDDEQQTFELAVSRSAEDKEKAKDEDAEAADEETESTDEDSADTTPAYVRIDDSPILYEITESEYEALMAASTGDLRHQELYWGDFAKVTQIDVELEGESYSLTTEKNKGENVWYYDGEKISIDELEVALTSLTAAEFTDEAADGKEEIALTLYLDDDNFETVQLAFYRKDGANVVAVVDGTPTALVDRSEMVDLIEAVNAIVLNTSEE